MRYAGTRRSEHNPLRSMPLVRSAAVSFGPTETDRLVGDLRNLPWSVSALAKAYDKARAELGRANRVNPAWRKKTQRGAMIALNVARGAMRSNARQIATLQARLLALAVPADLWADAAALGAR